MGLLDSIRGKDDDKDAGRERRGRVRQPPRDDGPQRRGPPPGGMDAPRERGGFDDSQFEEPAGLDDTPRSRPPTDDLQFDPPEPEPPARGAGRDRRGPPGSGQPAPNQRSRPAPREEPPRRNPGDPGRATTPPSRREDPPEPPADYNLDLPRDEEARLEDEMQRIAEQNDHIINLLEQIRDRLR